MTDPTISESINMSAKCAAEREKLTKETKVIEFSKYLFSELRDIRSPIYKQVMADASQGYRNSCIDNPHPFNNKIWKKGMEDGINDGGNEHISDIINKMKPNDMKDLHFAVGCSSFRCKINLMWQEGNKYKSCFFR